MLGAAGAAVNATGAGTASHLAPELLRPGAPVTPAADVFAFGILLWELWMGGAHAYAGARATRACHTGEGRLLAAVMI